MASHTARWKYSPPDWRCSAGPSLRRAELLVASSAAAHHRTECGARCNRIVRRRAGDELLELGMERLVERLECLELIAVLRQLVRAALDSLLGELAGAMDGVQAIGDRREVAEPDRADRVAHCLMEEA